MGPIRLVARASSGRRRSIHRFLSQHGRRWVRYDQLQVPAQIDADRSTELSQHRHRWVRYEPVGRRKSSIPSDSESECRAAANGGNSSDRLGGLFRLQALELGFGVGVQGLERPVDDIMSLLGLGFRVFRV
jgi:hypothetical protein